MADKDEEIVDEISDEELNDIFDADIIEDDVAETTDDDDAEATTADDEGDILDSDSDIVEDVPEELESPITSGEFLTELVEEGEDVVVENVNEILDEYKFTRLNDSSSKYRYIFDEILSKFWYNHVLEEDKRETADMNMYYRWLSVTNFNELVTTPEWETFIISEENGKKILSIYDSYDFPEIDDNVSALLSPDSQSSEPVSEIDDSDLDSLFDLNDEESPDGDIDAEIDDILSEDDAELVDDDKGDAGDSEESKGTADETDETDDADTSPESN